MLHSEYTEKVKWAVFEDNPLIGCLSVEFNEQGKEVGVTITPPDTTHMTSTHYQPIVRAFMGKQTIKDLMGGAKLDAFDFDLNDALYPMGDVSARSSGAASTERIYPSMSVFAPVRDVVKALREADILSDDETLHAYQKLRIVPSTLRQRGQHQISAGSDLLR